MSKISIEIVERLRPAFMMLISTINHDYHVIVASLKLRSIYQLSAYLSALIGFERKS